MPTDSDDWSAARCICAAFASNYVARAAGNFVAPALAAAAAPSACAAPGACAEPAPAPCVRFCALPHAVSPTDGRTLIRHLLLDAPGECTDEVDESAPIPHDVTAPSDVPVDGIHRRVIERYGLTPAQERAAQLASA